MSADAHPVRIFSAPTMLEAELCLAWLESDGIHAVIENEATHDVFGSVELSLDEKTGVAVVVSSEHEERARASVETYLAQEPLPDDKTVEIPAGDDDEDDEDDGDGDGDDDRE